MDIQKATQAYEALLEARIPLIQADLDFKRQRMAEGVFTFLRAASASARAASSVLSCEVTDGHTTNGQRRQVLLR